MLAALVAALALSGVSDAAATLSFGDAPTGWSITSGESDDNVGKVAAKGLKKKNRIRYSLAGSDGFSIKPRSGLVQYDGSAINADQTSITVTATDRKGKATQANVTITISVTREQQVQRQPPPPQAQLQQQQEPYEVVLSKSVRRYDEQAGRYRTTLEPDPTRKPTLYASGTRTRGAAFLESNDGSSTWIINDDSKAFTLVRMDKSTYTGTEERVMMVDYNGASLKEWTKDYTYTFTVTGTNSGGQSVTVTVVVCPVGGD